MKLKGHMFVSFTIYIIISYFLGCIKRTNMIFRDFESSECFSNVFLSIQNKSTHFAATLDPAVYLLKYIHYGKNWTKKITVSSTGEIKPLNLKWCFISSVWSWCCLVYIYLFHFNICKFLVQILFLVTWNCCRMWLKV